MLDEIKNVIIGMDHFIPPKSKINCAKIKVAIAPLQVKNFSLNDMYAISEAKNNPKI